ncbi:efflux transporter outer membrane subunit [Caldimonas caldifontis]|uniref:RND transporter n=1 Tax=Caldimonas caldifontis TaxID=1452508 RepID=A0A2S5SW05_9BURK|nr:efflux transporter outer membrane subunit [Caldimonas caldifontis]PPE66839.1 RND transporter [Caldimonas caldifontis]
MNTLTLNTPSRLLPLLGAVLLSACAAVGPDYERPATPLPAQYSAATPAADAVPAISSTWWTLFGDATLNGLVEAARRNNTDLQAAVARVEQAEALLREADALRWPSLGLSGGASRQRTSDLSAAGNGGTFNTFQLAATTGFEIDFWGRLRRASEAARAQALATDHAREVVWQTVSGLVAQGYFSLRMLDEQIALSRDTLASREESLRLLRLRLQGGAAARLEVDQAEAERAEAALQLRELQRQRDLAQSQLALLTGQPGLQVAAGAVRDLPLPPTPPAGLPSALLERRPDVRQAEALLASANAQIGVARAAMYPSISLTGAFGGQSAELSDLLKSGARIWSLGLGLDLPIFDAGRRRAQVAQAEARQRESLAAYQGAVQSAFRDVGDALTNLDAARAAQADVEMAAQASERALQTAKQRYDAGYSAYLELLDAQRSANSTRLRVLDNRRAQLAATVDLFKALGGGWTPPEVAAAAH